MGGERRGGLKRQGGLDPAVVDFQKRAAQNTAALTAKQKRDRTRVRVKYDLPASLKDAVAVIGKRHGTSASQAAAVLLGWAVTRYAEGAEGPVVVFECGRETSRTPRFEWNVVLPDWWVSVFESFLVNGDL